MNSMDILDAIGAIDDILIKRAKEKQKSHHAIWTAVGTLAACFMLIIMLPMALNVFRGASDSANQSADKAEAEEMYFDYVYVRIDVASSTGEWSFVEFDSLKAIHEAIDSITGPSEKEDGNDHVQQEAAKDESSPLYSADSASKPKKGEYTITLRHHDGSIREYRLTETTLIDLTTRESFSITKEQAEHLLSLIKK